MLALALEPRLLFLLAGAFPLCRAWNDNEHMLVADVAEHFLHQWGRDDIIQNVIANLWAENAEELPHPFQGSKYGARPSEKENAFSSVAPWMDFVSKGEGIEWHTYPFGFLLNNATLKAERNSVLTGKLLMRLGGNALRSVTESIEVFKGTKTDWPLPFAIRLFIHVVGDLHQPLHLMTTTGGYCWWRGINKSAYPDLLCDTVVDEPFPQAGDGGGNCRGVQLQIGSFPSQVAKRGSPRSLGDATGTINLHEVWDAAGFNYQTPGTALSAQERAAIADELVRQFGKEINGPNPPNADWTEAVSLLDQVYPEDVVVAFNAADNGVATLSDEYLQQVRVISKEQIFKAGLRLASELVAIPKFSGTSASMLDVHPHGYSRSAVRAFFKDADSTSY